MSYLGDAPDYILATKRPDGMIDYKLMRPHNRGICGIEEVVHVAPCAARDEEQAFGRIQNLIHPRQKTIKFIYTEDLA